MLPYKLNKQIVIEKETSVKNAVGTIKEEYSFFKEVYADVFISSGSAQYAPEGTVPFTNVFMTVRYDKELDYKCRIVYNNNYYKIEHIEEIGRRHWMKLKVIVWDRSTNY